jgi:hypothetical protein
VGGVICQFKRFYLPINTVYNSLDQKAEADSGFSALWKLPLCAAVDI